MLRSEGFERRRGWRVQQKFNNFFSSPLLHPSKRRFIWDKRERDIAGGGPTNLRGRSTDLSSKTATPWPEIDAAPQSAGGTGRRRRDDGAGGGGTGPRRPRPSRCSHGEEAHPEAAAVAAFPRDPPSSSPTPLGHTVEELPPRRRRRSARRRRP